MENKLAQPGEMVFERNLAIIAGRRQEVQVFSDGFVYKGYICGLDEKWMQLYGHEENDQNDVNAQWRFLLINRDNISAVGPNGNNLSDLDSETRDWVNKKIQIFSDVCDKFSSVRGVKNGKEKF